MHYECTQEELHEWIISKYNYSHKRLSLYYNEEKLTES